MPSTWLRTLHDRTPAITTTFAAFSTTDATSDVASALAAPSSTTIAAHALVAAAAAVASTPALAATALLPTHRALRPSDAAATASLHAAATTLSAPAHTAAAASKVRDRDRAARSDVRVCGVRHNLQRRRVRRGGAGSKRRGVRERILPGCQGLERHLRLQAS